jgi:hypothetical protein
VPFQIQTTSAAGYLNTETDLVTITVGKDWRYPYLESANLFARKVQPSEFPASSARR